MSHSRSGRISLLRPIAFAIIFAMIFTPVFPAVNADAQNGEPLKVVASFSIAEDWTARVGGDLVELSSIVPAGGDAHTFDPNPATVASIADADVIVAIGPGLEPWLDSMVDASGTDATVIQLVDHMPLLSTDDDGHDDDNHADEVTHEDDHGGDHTEDDHEHGDGDPHIWGDVSNVITAVEVIRDTLAEADPDNADTFHANAAAYIAELEALDTYIQEQIATVPEENRKLVTSHDTFGYYADAYGLEVVGTALGAATSDTGDPSAGDVATLVGIIEDAGVPAIFTENTVNPDLMQSIADEAGVELAPTLYTDALGEEGSAGASYIGMMTYNTGTIVAALGGE